MAAGKAPITPIGTARSAAAEPAVASWVAHPAPWLVPLPHQPIQLRAS